MKVYLYYEGFRVVPSTNVLLDAEIIDIIDVHIPATLTVYEGKGGKLIRHNASGEVYLLNYALRCNQQSIYVNLPPYGNIHLPIIGAVR